MENMNVLEIGINDDLDNHPNITYTLNGELLSTVHCLYDEQRTLIKAICKATKCMVVDVVTKTDGTVEYWQTTY